MTTIHKIYNADSSNLKYIDDKSVHLVVTSPPYPMIEMWDNLFKEQSPVIESYFLERNFDKAFEAMHSILDNVWKVLTSLSKLSISAQTSIPIP